MSGEGKIAQLEGPVGPSARVYNCVPGGFRKKEKEKRKKEEKDRSSWMFSLLTYFQNKIDISRFCLSNK